MITKIAGWTFHVIYMKYLDEYRIQLVKDDGTIGDWPILWPDGKIAFDHFYDVDTYLMLANVAKPLCEICEKLNEILEKDAIIIF